MIDLYSVFTANGQKIHIMLEECDLEYTAHAVDLHGGAHRTPEFRKLNPFARVPVLVDDDGTGGAPVVVSETLAILDYLAAKAGRLMPADARGRADVMQWLASIAANVGPVFRGEFMFTAVVPGKIQPAIDYFKAEAAKALAMIDDHLRDREYLVAGQYTVADISAYPVAATSAKRLPDGVAPYANIRRWMEAISRRPAVQRGMAVLAP
ncbi:MAG: glutathione S-transferase family protein [Rhodospirillaceae bacterium]|nr:glutathione S-transferase family protein [Rhodospirillaceae bacterium]